MVHYQLVIQLMNEVPEVKATALLADHEKEA